MPSSDDRSHSIRLEALKTVSFVMYKQTHPKTYVDNDFNNPHKFLSLITVGQLVSLLLWLLFWHSPRGHVVDAKRFCHHLRPGN